MASQRCDESSLEHQYLPKILSEFFMKKNPPTFRPELARLSWSRRIRLDSKSLVKLELLRSECSEAEFPPASWRTVVMAVSASSTIEEEGLPDEIVSRLIAMTEAGEHVDADLRQRIDSQKDIAKAYAWLLRLRADPVINGSIIKFLHKRMFFRTKQGIAGNYKKTNVVIRWHKGGGEVESVPTLPPERTEQYLEEICRKIDDELENRCLGNFLAVAEFSVDFLAIHPFADGNGRIARILCGYLLQKIGYWLIGDYPLDQIILETRHRYYSALNESQSYWRRDGENILPWVEYFLDCLIEHSRRAKWERSVRLEKSKASHLY